MYIFGYDKYTGDKIAVPERNISLVMMPNASHPFHIIRSMEYNIKVTDASEIEKLEKLLGAKMKSEQRALTNALLQPTQGMTKYDDPASAAAEEGLIRLLYLDPKLIIHPSLPEAKDFSSPALGKIYSVLTAYISEGHIRACDIPDINQFSDSLDPDEINLFRSLMQKPENITPVRQRAEEYIAKIKGKKSC